MKFRYLLVLLLGLSCVRAETARADFPFPLGHEIADSVLVVKSERRLYLMKAGRILKAINVRWGSSRPARSSARATSGLPEGHYMLDGRKADSDYFLSIHISYPDEADRARARSLGVDPGGQIMIHGLPNAPRYELAHYRGNGLDGWLHRGQQLRHDRHLANDARVDADRDPALAGRGPRAWTR